MSCAQGILKNEILSNRMKTAIITKDEYALDFSEFEKLLDFDETSSGGVVVSVMVTPSSISKNNEKMILEKGNCLRNKIGLCSESKIIVEKKIDNKEEQIDFSMFDNLLNDFKEKEVVKNIQEKSLGKSEKINLLKDEIKYFQSKIDEKYSLENLEKYESKLFEIKNKLDDLRGYCSFSFLDYKFSSTTLNEIICSLNDCSKELEEIMINDKIGKLNKKRTIERINDKISNNIKKQKEFLVKVKNEVVSLNNNLASKIYFCMVKRMMFNLYRLIVGMYKLENSKKNHLKLNTGIFLIINALVGIDKALCLDFDDEGYYYYKDYVNSDMNSKDITMLTFSFMNKASVMINNIQKIMKNNFAKYKNYSDDYEEVYFKLSKFKVLIDEQAKECENLLEIMNNKEKKNIKVS